MKIIFRLRFVAAIFGVAMFMVSCSDKVKDNFYTVTFDTDGGNPVPAVQKVKADETVNAPDNPEKQGYVFLFWHLSEATTAYDFQTPVNSNITLVAQWEDEANVEYWQVTWALNGGSFPANSNHAKQVAKGGTLAEPNEPTKTDAEFDGWYKETTLTNKVSFPYDVSGVTANITLYAKWSGETLPAEVTVQGNSLAEKLAWIKNNAASNTIYTVEVNADAPNLVPHVLAYSGKSNITIRMKGIGAERNITLSGKGSLFTVEDGVTLILDENITLFGNYPASYNDASFVRVNTGGELIMNAGATITRNHIRSTSALGGGVFVERDGAFTMNGGTVKDNGTIGYYQNSSNQGFSGGGGVFVAGGTFIMNEGTIENNSASLDALAGGYSCNGGGVYVKEGFISVYANGEYISTYHSGNFFMNGGTIKDNTATNGGGVLIFGHSRATCIFNMNGGTIEGNSAEYQGGGVYCYSTVFTMSGGTIKSNTAHILRRNVTSDDSVPYGGGVIIRSGSSFEKNGGTIYGYTEGDSNSNVLSYSQYGNEVIITDKGSAVYAAYTEDKVYVRKETTSVPDDKLSADCSKNPLVSRGDWDG